MAKLGYKTMPKSVDFRVGCKVQWQYYATEEEAKAASEIARHNSEIDRSLGYDFGYCSPGSIYLVMEEGRYKGLYEVCTS